MATSINVRHHLSENQTLGGKGANQNELNVPGRKRAAFVDISNSANVTAQPGHSGILTRSKAAAVARLCSGGGKVLEDPDDTVMQGTTPSRNNAPISADWKEGIPPEDRQDLSNPQFVSEYVNPIFVNMNRLELKYRQSADFMARTQTDINERMRAVLIDWLVEVHWKFKLVPETLYLTVNLIDRYLEKTPNLPRTRLQLVGVTCLLIASKYEDIYAPEMKDIVHICDKTYQRHEVMQMEVDILNRLDFCITSPSAMIFLLRYAKIMRCDDKQFFLAQYCLELALPEYRMLQYSATQLAAGALYLSNKLLRKSPAWPAHVAVHCPSSTEQEVKGVAKELCTLLQAATEDQPSGGTQLKAVRKKFQLSKFRGVSRMVLG